MPHCEQKEPEGSEVASTGSGTLELFSIIVLWGRAVGIFLFAGRIPVSLPCTGVGTSRCGNGFLSGSGTSEGAITGLAEEMKLFSFFAHSLHSRFLSTPDCLAKVRTA